MELKKEQLKLENNIRKLVMNYRNVIENLLDGKTKIIRGIDGMYELEGNCSIEPIQEDRLKINTLMDSEVWKNGNLTKATIAQIKKG